MPVPTAAFDWHVFRDLVLHPSHPWLVGLWTTVYVSVLAQAIGVALGLAVELVRRSRRGALRAAAGFYVVAVPRHAAARAAGPRLQRAGGARRLPLPRPLAARALLSRRDAGGILTLAVNESAYMAEIIRAAINSVDVGQMEAAESLGMRRGAAMRQVILPQALRIIIPPLGNEFNGMMKVTSLLSVIGVEELFLNAQELNSATFHTFEIFLAAAVYYLALTTIWP